ncbi:MAG: S49 family peptidase [Gammaproteobacteria bacterium]|nr:S49 family peptidase [Gammaproteobacteria bacterium]
MFNRKNDSGLPGANAAPVSANDALLKELAIDYMHDKKIKRRWKMALFVLIGLYFVGIMIMAVGGKGTVPYGKAHTALVKLNGVIGIDTDASAEIINRSLRNAFKAENSKGVILQINSPGGSPVQSADINSEISRLREEYPNKPIHVVMADVAASGGYFVAVAADQIYANRSSIVGSIGVRMDSFGFVDAMKKYGIERRSITAGENKAILDPFLPMDPAQKAHAEKMVAQVHQHFIDVVEAGRGERLAENPDLYSGLFWSGQEAKKLGLIDDFGSVTSVARDVIGHDKIVNYTYQRDFWEQLNRDLGVAIGMGIGQVLGGPFKMQ